MSRDRLSIIWWDRAPPPPPIYCLRTCRPACCHRPDRSFDSTTGHEKGTGDLRLFGIWRGLRPHRTTIEPSTRQFGLPA